MAFVCPHCGMYAQNSFTADRQLWCSYCQRETELNIFPLFIVTGTSGVGKTTVIPEIRKCLPECVIFDKDLLLALSAHGQEQFYDSWLLIASSIAQCGRHTVICGTILPQDLEQCPNRGLVSTIHFLNLHCNDQVREQRLCARPEWRRASNAEYVERQKVFARWLLDHASTSFDPPMPILDTSSTDVCETGQQIAAWVGSVLGQTFTRPPSTFY